jgi:hypothetical protein
MRRFAAALPFLSCPPLERFALARFGALERFGAAAERFAGARFFFGVALRRFGALAGFGGGTMIATTWGDSFRC